MPAVLSPQCRTHGEQSPLNLTSCVRLEVRDAQRLCEVKGVEAHSVIVK